VSVRNDLTLADDDIACVSEAWALIGRAEAQAKCWKQRAANTKSALDEVLRSLAPKPQLAWRLYWLTDLPPWIAAAALGRHKNAGGSVPKILRDAFMPGPLTSCGRAVGTHDSCANLVEQATRDEQFFCASCAADFRARQQIEQELDDRIRQARQRNNGDVRDRIAELRSMPYSEYLRTPEWTETRKAALRRAGYACQVCSAKLDLNVHHRTYERRGNEAAADLIVLCRQCHATFHGKTS